MSLDRSTIISASNFHRTILRAAERIPSELLDERPTLREASSESYKSKLVSIPSPTTVPLAQSKRQLSYAPLNLWTLLSTKETPLRIWIKRQAELPYITNGSKAFRGR